MKFIKHIFCFCLITLGFSAYSQMNTESNNIGTKVLFRTSDTVLQKIFNEAERKSLWNIKKFGKYTVLIEGSIYNGVWLETQPMGGTMYAKRNADIACNNIQIFLDYQRVDGRFPGMITFKNNKLDARYGWFQGYCFPMPAFEMYFWLKKDKAYLNQLYNALEKFDDYLWKTRDSDQNGCLETWCVWDTGEDASSRYNYYPNSWPFDYPPSRQKLIQMSRSELINNCNENRFDTTTNILVPMESMDVMSYSYSGREVLELISKELKNGKEQFWQDKANMVRAKIKSYLWDASKSACFDKDKDNNTLNVLVHNNLRCMYYHSFDQEMADAFIKNHLVNPKEFWTPMPLTSIAINEPIFRNVAGNNWSGQPQGLTYQRSIAALSNYGHYAELTVLGKKLLKVVGDSLKFTQQFDPFTATINNTSDGYGPTILTSLEFISLMYGVNISKDIISWSCISSEENYDYTQVWDNKTFRLQTKGNIAHCYINNSEVFSFTKGARVVTDLNGSLLDIAGIDTKPCQLTLADTHGLKSIVNLQPNQVYHPAGPESFKLDHSVEFYLKEQ